MFSALFSTYPFAQRVVILGLGESGLAMARWCAQLGAQVTVCDDRETPHQLTTLQQDLPSVIFIHSSMTAPTTALLEAVTQSNALYISPGLSPERVAALVDIANQHQVIIGSELTLFAEGLAHLRAHAAYEPKILAITGTNGKTTVTALTHTLIERCGFRAVIAGNIGPSLLDTLQQTLQRSPTTADLPQVWVLELSSFQLYWPHALQATAATILNITQDHLDWHGTMQAYIEAKLRIFSSNTLRLMNRDDSTLRAAITATANATTIIESFGTDTPIAVGDWGLQNTQGMHWLVKATGEELPQKKRRPITQDVDITLQRLMPADALRIRGRHNYSNALAALALAQAAGCSLAPMLYGLREYRGEPHRLESIAIVNEVEYFDDSKGTNVGATVAALHSLGHDRKLVVLLGGDGKGQDFTPLAAPIHSFCRAVVLYGRDAQAIETAIATPHMTHDTSIAHAATLEQAVQLAQQHAQRGDAVLLSPACASLDMFRNYVHRGESFRSAVNALAQENAQEITS